MTQHHHLPPASCLVCSSVCALCVCVCLCVCAWLCVSVAVSVWAFVSGSVSWLSALLFFLFVGPTSVEVAVLFPLHARVCVCVCVCVFVCASVCVPIRMLAHH